MNVSMLRRLQLPPRAASLLMATLVACATTYPRRNPTGEIFPTISGETLAGERKVLPRDVAGAPVVLLIGYEQDSQFGIDRWLIGMNQIGIRARTYELPTIQGMVPRMISGTIDEGMRGGIPPEDWMAVLTVYGDADRIARFTGNENKQPARILVLDTTGEVVYFHDSGFSAKHLNALCRTLERLDPAAAPVMGCGPRPSSAVINVGTHD